MSAGMLWDAIYDESDTSAVDSDDERPAEEVQGSLPEEANGSAIEPEDGNSTTSADAESDEEVHSNSSDDTGPINVRKRPKKTTKGPARKYPCPYEGCSYVANRWDSLWYHKKATHTGEKPHRCTWPDCGKRFIRNGDLARHTRMHTGERPYKCTWPGCDADFGDPSHLRRHILTHTREKNYPCDFPGCNKKYKRKEALTVHKRKIHEGKRRRQQRNARKSVKSSKDLAEPCRIDVYHDKETNKVTIQFGKDKTVYDGQLAKDKDGKDYVVSNGRMIPIREIVEGIASRNVTVQQI